MSILICNEDGNAYVEAQVHGQVKGTDIAEIHFRPKNSNGSDEPTPQVARWAYDNKVKLFVRGKEVDLDAQFNPNTSAKAIKDAIASGDMVTVLAFSSRLSIASKTYNKPAGNPPDKILGTLFDETGYSGKPTVGTSADVTTAWRNGGTMMVRGVEAVNGTRTKGLRDFQSGDYYVGNGMYGNGTYVAHGGSYNAGKFIPYDPKRADFNAKDAVNTLIKESYVNPYGVTMRMVLAKDANIVTSKDLVKQAKALDAEIDKYHKTETNRLKSALGGTPTSAAVAAYQAEETNWTTYFKKNYGRGRFGYAGSTTATVLLPSGKTKQVDLTTYTVFLVGKGPSSGKLYELDGYKLQSVVSPLGGTRYEAIAPDGYRIPVDMGSAYRAANPGAPPHYDYMSRSEATQAALKHNIEQRALNASGLTTKPDDDTTGLSAPAAAAKIAQLDKDVATAREVLFGDTKEYSGSYHYVSGRLATILGHDAIALEDGWGKGINGDSRFMNLLNRSKVIIQKDELTFNTAERDVVG
jgi:hypothetical protein